MTLLSSQHIFFFQRSLSIKGFHNLNSILMAMKFTSQESTLMLLCCSHGPQLLKK